MGRVRSPKRRVRDVDFMVGLSSDSVRIVFILAEAIQGFLAGALQVRISRPAQYLVRFEGDFYLLRATFHMWAASIMRVIFRGRRSI